MRFAQTDVICDSVAGKSVFFILVTCSEPEKNECRSKSYSQTGSAAFCHSSPLPAFLYENKLFGSPAPIETAAGSRYLKDWVLETFTEGSSAAGLVFEEKLGGRGEKKVRRDVKNYYFIPSSKNKTGFSYT